MHIKNRLTVLLVTSILIVPLGTSVLLLGNLRDIAKDRLKVAVDTAEDSYRRAVNISVNEYQNRQAADRAKEKMMELGARKLEARRQIVSLRQKLAETARESFALSASEEKAEESLRRSRDELGTFVREAYLNKLDVHEGIKGTFFRRLSGERPGDDVAEAFGESAIAHARAELIDTMLQSTETLSLAQSRLHAAAGDVGVEITRLEREWDKLTSEYRKAQREYDKAEASLQLNEDQLAEIRAITGEVESEVLRMQSELARIDTRLRTQAERKLIQMGLREDRPDRYTQPDGEKPIFFWPASGTVSAGFLQESYLRFFGVPHKGIDIVVPQGTDVRSAADGIVYLVRDGGARGYSYILIGHRSGYATLYGHLSSFSVQPGDEIMRGHVIGKSGGTPGTRGAGPMTTAAHLHFELMQNGVHVDPKTVLP